MIIAGDFSRVRNADFRRISVERLMAMINGLGSTNRHTSAFRSSSKGASNRSLPRHAFHYRGDQIVGVEHAPMLFDAA